MLTTLHPSEQQALSLSVRQQQILELLAQGKSNKEIASELDIECGTVKQHLFVLFRKLNVTSRAKAALVVAELLKASPHAVLPGATSGKLKKANKISADLNTERYIWRLVCAVSVMVPQQLTSKTDNIRYRDQFLADLREIAHQLVTALDGHIATLPDGGMLVWFGHPVAHLDDADRAAYFAQYLHWWVKAYPLEGLDISIGVAANPEMVSTNAPELYGAQSFQKAAILARHAKGLAWPLSNQLIKQLAPMGVPWLDLKTKKNAQALMLEDIGTVMAIGPETIALKNVADRWGGLPFMEGIFENVHSGVAQWLSVESWPAVTANSLIDTIGHLAFAKGFQLISLRTPSNRRRDRQLDSYLSQIEFVFNRLDPNLKSIHLVHQTQFASASERLVAMLVAIAEQSCLVIQVYGLKALSAFEKVIGPAGIERLASRRILVVAANVHDAGVPKTSLRLLGSRPNAAPFSRIFTMQTPDFESLPEDIRVDLQAMLDDLSELAKDLLLTAANELDTPITKLMQTFDVPQHQLQSAIGELTSLGLVAPKPEGGFEFCNLITAKALRQLHAPVISPSSL